MANYNLITASGAFKTRFLRMDRDMFNSQNVILAKIKRNDTATGDSQIISVPVSFGGGRGTGVLPRPNTTNYLKMTIQQRKTYAVVEVDNEAIAAAESDDGSFVRMTKEPVKRGIQGWQGNASRILFNDSLASSGIGNGRLGSFTQAGAVTLVSANVYDVVMDASTWKLANWETRDYVNVSASITSEFEVTNVTASSRTVRLTQTNGAPLVLSGLGVGTYHVYMQNSFGKDPTGMRGALLATSGTLYGLPIGYRWQASSQLAWGGLGLNVDMLNQQYLEVKYAFGENPDMQVGSFVQYRKLLGQIEDQKRYMAVESRNEGPKGKFSFSALEFVTDGGPIPIIAERFVEDDTFYTLNSDFIEMHARPGAGWIEDPTGAGGSIFFRSPTDDSWQARYAVYFEYAITPPAHGIMTGLATT